MKRRTAVAVLIAAIAMIATTGTAEARPPTCVTHHVKGACAQSRLEKRQAKAAEKKLRKARG
jgi:hypothetical protein